MLTEPVAVEIDGDERRRNREIIDQRKKFDEERQFLRRRDELDDINTPQSHRSQAHVQYTYSIPSTFLY